MAWGSFVKKLKGFGNKIISGARKVVNTVKPIVDVVSPYIPGGKIVQGVVNQFDDWVPDGKAMSGPPIGYGNGQRINSKNNSSDIRSWVNSQLRA